MSQNKNINQSKNPTTAISNFSYTEKFFNQVIESIEDYAVFTVDKIGHITSWNSGAANLFGYHAEEILGRDGYILYSPLDISNRIPEREMEKALSLGRAGNERYHIRKDRSLFWGSGLVFPLYDEENNHQGFTKVMRNLTARKEAEDKLLQARAFAQSIVETAQYPMVILNTDLTINTASNAFYQLFKISLEEAQGKEIFEVWDHPKLKKLLIDIMPHHDFFEEFEIEEEIEGFGTRILAIRARKLFWLEKHSELIKLSLEDITYKRILEHHKEAFISIASHEIKTPVTVIRAFAQMMERELNEYNIPSLRKAIAKINEQALKLTELSSDLLNITELEAGHFLLNMEELDLLSLLISTIEDLNQVHKNHQLILKEKRAAMVSADKTKIAEVLVNLINNAVKYSPEADRVIISLRKDSNEVVVSIKDFGIGIPEEERPNIFKRFSRTSNVKEHHISGHGLGLYIAFEIIKHHGGRLWVESEENKGSEFFFSLPLVN
jgi:PAS domain S-box-containing protein